MHLRALFLLVLALTYLMPVLVFGQTVDPDKVAERRQELEEELAGLEDQIGGFRTLIRGKQNEAVSLERDIAILDAQIEKAKLEIRARDISIGRLNNAIGQKTQYIGDLLEKIKKQKISLSELLRRVNELDQTSVVESVLSTDNVSDFFADLDNFNSIQDSVHQSFLEIRETKDITETERQQLESRKAEEQQLKSLQVLEKNKIEEREDEKQRVLDITKGQEAEYQKLLSSKQKDAATIRSQLFLLLGSPDIPFEKAVSFANKAFKETGVRPAFLLAIITQETELGRNIGQCNLPDDPPKYKWYNIMKPSRDQKPYLEITESLGLDPALLPLSCPQAGGWGGAMGPAQFIPSTWNIVKGQVANLTGHNPPNPWNPEDAFMASATLLRDNGASAGGYDAERKAALRYYAGGNWWKSAYAFYGDSVMEIAEKIQGQLDVISN